MRREAASTRVVPRGILVPDRARFFCSLEPVVPLVDSARSCAEDVVRRACQAGWYREWPSSRAGEGLCMGVGCQVWALRDDDGPTAPPLKPKTRHPKPGATGCG